MNDIDFEITPDLLASKGKRFAHYIIDLIPQYAVSYALAYLFFYIGEFTGNYTLNDYWNNMTVLEDYAFSYGLLLSYFFLMEGFTLRTLGKYATNTKVVMQDGSTPTRQDILIRSLCRIIPFDALSFLGTNGKGWHDSISKTYVVDVEKFEAKRNTALALEELGKETQE